MKHKSHAALHHRQQLTYSPFLAFCLSLLLALALICAGAIGSKAFAASQIIDMKIVIENRGNVVMSPNISVRDGEKTMITEERDSLTSTAPGTALNPNIKHFVEVSAANQVPNQGNTADANMMSPGILISLTTGDLAPNGARLHVYQTQILGRDGQPSRVPLGPLGGDNARFVTVTPTRRPM